MLKDEIANMIWINHEDAQRFLDRIYELRKEGRTEKETAEILGLYTIGLRRFRSAAHVKVREYLKGQATKMKEAGKSVSEIAKELGKEESTIRMLLEK